MSVPCTMKSLLACLYQRSVLLRPLMLSSCHPVHLSLRGQGFYHLEIVSTLACEGFFILGCINVCIFSRIDCILQLESYVSEKFNFPLFIFLVISVEKKSPIPCPGPITCFVDDGGKITVFIRLTALGAY